MDIGRPMPRTGVGRETCLVTAAGPVLSHGGTLRQFERPVLRLAAVFAQSRRDCRRTLGHRPGPKGRLVTAARGLNPFGDGGHALAGTVGHAVAIRADGPAGRGRWRHGWPWATRCGGAARSPDRLWPSLPVGPAPPHRKREHPLGPVLPDFYDLNTSDTRLLYCGIATMVKIVSLPS